MKASIAALGLAAACLPHAASAATFVANFVAVDGFEERCSARNVCTYIFAPNGSFTLSGTSQGQNFVDASGGRFSIRSEPVFRLDYTRADSNSATSIIVETFSGRRDDFEYGYDQLGRYADQHINRAYKRELGRGAFRDKRSRAIHMGLADLGVRRGGDGPAPPPGIRRPDNSERSPYLSAPPGRIVPGSKAQSCQPVKAANSSATTPGAIGDLVTVELGEAGPNSLKGAC